MVHENKPINRGERQYDLRINGESFFNLPTCASSTARRIPQDDLCLKLPDDNKKYKPLDFNNQGLEGDPTESVSDFGFGDCHSNPTIIYNSDLQLSKAGSADSSMTPTEIVDNLNSNVHPVVIESLRAKIVHFLPQLDDLISRAVMNALFLDCDSQHSGMDRCSVSSLGTVDLYQLECDAVCEAYRWMQARDVKKVDKELLMSRMQCTIDSIIVRVRTEVITADEATRVLLSVAAVLGLTFANMIPRVSVILDGLNARTECESLA
jgi:hypothetical protein